MYSDWYGAGVQVGAQLGVGTAPTSGDFRQNLIMSALHLYCLRKYNNGFKVVTV